MAKARSETEETWRALVSLVLDSRGEWRRQVTTVTGLPFGRMRALKRLAQGPHTLRDLAEAMGVDAPAATVAINDLETRGLVLRREHPEDRRAKLVSITPAGRALVRAMHEIPDPPPEPLASASVEDVRRIARLLGLKR